MMDGLRLARVVGASPSGHAVDLVFLDDLSRVPQVQVLTGAGSTNTGIAGLVEPDIPEDTDRWEGYESGTRDIIAVVGFYRTIPIVLGFLYPQVSQMLFADRNRYIHRHASDVYTTVDEHGNLELFHPSGTYLRIGATPEHEDLTGKDFDGKWKIEQNTDAAVHVHLSVANAGEKVASIDIDPGGNIAAETSGNAAITAEGNVEVASGADIKLTAGGDITIAASGSIAMSGTRIDLN